MIKHSRVRLIVRTMRALVVCSVLVWENLLAVELVHRFGFGPVKDISVSTDGRELVVEGAGIWVWDLETLELEGHSAGPLNYYTDTPEGYYEGKRIKSPDGRHYLTYVDWSAPIPLTVREHDADSGDIVRTWQQHEDLAVVVYSSDGSKLLTGGHNGMARIWGRETGALEASMQANQAAPYRFYSIDLSPDGSQLLTATDQVNVFDVDSGELVRSHFFSRYESRYAAWHPVGNAYLVGASRKIVIYSSVSGVEIGELQTTSLTEKLLFTRGASKLVSLHYDDPEIVVWDAKTWTQLGSIGEFRTGRIWKMAITSDGLYGRFQDRVWDINSGDCLCEPESDSDQCNEWEFPESYSTTDRVSPDGRFRLIPSEGRLVDPHTGATIHEFQLLPWAVGAFSQDGRTIFTYECNYTCDAGPQCWRLSLRHWDIETGAMIREIRPELATPFDKEILEDDGVVNHYSVFSPSGRLLASGGNIWEAATGRLLFAIGSHPNDSTIEDVVAFSSDELRFFTGGTDGIVRMWDIRDLVSSPKTVRQQDAVGIEWNMGVLQFSPSLEGPWTDLPAASPMPLSPTGEKGFFRVKVE